ncbi:conserved Plasmodium protein, unknown function [Plasmodium gaboni]|uniref:Uncharacterized protein n=1 Tax=Plasmodium gaboni TaxID=647221 RepID=A0ABY1UIE7_9APIC|nr:conserved Plasmodium protein, unknown function [Plasmodium gaboni]
MEKEEDLKDFCVIDNRGSDSPIDVSCDNIIDKNGNVIYKSYNNVYKLTYKHIFKYKRISCISTDVVYDENGNGYTPLYHYYYDDVINSDTNKEENYEINEEIYNRESTKQECLKYDMYELLLLRFLKYECENDDSEDILNKYCFIRERKCNKPGGNKYIPRDRSNNNNNIGNNVNGMNNYVLLNNNNMRIRNIYNNNNNNNNINNNNNFNNNFNIHNNDNNDDCYVKGRHRGNYLSSSLNNINGKVFKNLDDNCYNLPTNNLYIDKEGKMHLTGKEHYNAAPSNEYNHNNNKNTNNYNNNSYNNNNFFNNNYNDNNYNNSNNKGMGNKYDRSLNYLKKEHDMVDYEYNNKGNIRKNDSEKYWDNPPLHYSKKNNYDIFTLGDIKKYAKNNEKKGNNKFMNMNDNSSNNNMNSNSNSYNNIFKDNDEENLTKSNFAKWFKNNNMNVNENTDIIKYLNNKNNQGQSEGKNNNNSNNNIKNNSNNNNSNNKNNIFQGNSRNYENAMYNINNNNNNSNNKNEASFNTDNINTNNGREEEKISNTVAELLMKQISMIKERNKGMDVMEKKNTFGFLDNNYQNYGSNNNSSLEKNNMKENDIYSKEASKRIMDIFRTLNSNGLVSQESLLENQGIPNNNNNYNNYSNNRNKNQNNINMNHNNMNNSNNNMNNNMNYYKNNHKYHSMDNVTYKKNFINNYSNNDGNNNNNSNNNSNNVEHYYMNNKKAFKNKINNYHNLPDNKNNIMNNNTYNNINKNNLSNMENFPPSLSFNNSDVNKNNTQGNINITPIINSILRLDNEVDNVHNNSISENIQNAKVSNVLDSLKSLLKASKNQGNNNYNIPKNFNNNNNNNNHNNSNSKFINYNSQQFYPSHQQQQQQQIQMQTQINRTHLNDYNKKKFNKKERYPMKYPEFDGTTNETMMVREKAERQLV